MRATGKDGFLYSITFGEPIVGEADKTLEKSQFYKIKSIAAADSGIPKKDPAAGDDAIDLAPDMVYYGRAGQKLVEGDVVIPMQLNKISFITDVSDSSQATSHDITTQADVDTGLRAWAAGAFKDRTGNISGYVETNSPEQMELLKEYRMVIVDDGNSVTVYKSITQLHHYMLSRAERVPEGDREMWEYFPVITEQLDMDKPMDGAQSFNFNYRVDGSAKPVTYFLTKETA